MNWKQLISPVVACGVLALGAVSASAQSSQPTPADGTQQTSQQQPTQQETTNQQPQPSDGVKPIPADGSTDGGTKRDMTQYATGFCSRLHVVRIWPDTAEGRRRFLYWHVKYKIIDGECIGVNSALFPLVEQPVIIDCRQCQGTTIAPTTTNSDYDLRIDAPDPPSNPSNPIWKIAKLVTDNPVISGNGDLLWFEAQSGGQVKFRRMQFDDNGTTRYAYLFRVDIGNGDKVFIAAETDDVLPAQETVMMDHHLDVTFPNGSGGHSTERSFHTAKLVRPNGDPLNDALVIIRRMK